MAVMMPNTTLTLRRKTHQYAEDAHGVRVATVGWGAPVGPFPGAVVLPEDGDTSAAPRRILADPRLAPITPDDELTDAQGRVYIVRSARAALDGFTPELDHVACTGELTPPYVP